MTRQPCTRSRRRWAVGAACAATLAGLAIAPTSAGADPGVSAPRHLLRGTHPSWATAAARRARVPADERLTVHLDLAMRNAATATTVSRQVSDPADPHYGQYLTPAQVRAAFAPTSATVRAVEAWATSAGLAVVDVPTNRAWVSVRGTAGDLEQALHVGLHRYRHAGRDLRAPDADPGLPASLATTVTGITGLTEMRRSPATVPPRAGFRNAPPCGAYYGEKIDTTDPAYNGEQLPYAPCGYVPSQLRSLYGVDLTNGDGTGQTVAIVDAFGSPTIVADASKYATRNDPDHPLTASLYSEQVETPTPGLEAPNECDAAGWYGEQTLDVEAVHAIAPGAKIAYYGSADCNDSTMDDTLNGIVTSKAADVVSNSYGDTGEDRDTTEANTIAQQAIMEGITLLFSSGDSGDEVANLGFPSPDFEASSPYVTAVGGTSVGIGQNGSAVLETGWETARSTLSNSAYSPATYTSGSGGGTSRVFAEPWYQQGVVPDALAAHNQVGDARGRVVPDISALADPNTGMLIGQTQTFPDGVYYDQYRIGGTSLAAPLVAGLVAVTNQRTGYDHGFLNPLLYAKGLSSGALRDVVDAGTGVARVDYANGIDASDGLVRSVRLLDYDGLTIHTADGYDDVTGLGTPNGTSFLTLSRSAPTVSQRVNTPLTAGDTATDSVTISDALQPTGKVAFALYSPADAKCGGQPIGSEEDPVTGDATGGVATTATGFVVPTAGTYHWIATYEGDTNNAPIATPCEFGTLEVDPATPTVTLDANPPTGATVGTSTTFTATVTGTVGTPSGTVEFRHGSATLCAAVSLSGTPTTATCTVTWSTATTDQVQAVYNGDATYGTHTAVLDYPIGKGIPSVILTGAPAAGSTAGSSVTFTAAVSGAGAAPTGTVDFSVGGATCTGVALVDGAAECTTDTLPVGTPTVTASYSGDLNYTPAADSLQYTVAKATPTVALSADPAGTVDQDRVDGHVTFRATVTGPAGVATGTVEFTTDGGAPIVGCGPATVVDGTATCRPTYLPAGTLKVTAQYAGDATYNPAAHSTTYTVRVPTVTAVSATPRGAAPFGHAVILSFTVEPTPLVLAAATRTAVRRDTGRRVVAPDAVVHAAAAGPTGSVAVTVRGAAVAGCGSVRVKAGRATCRTTALPVGRLSVLATYSGDAAVAGSSTALTYRVTAAPTPSTPATTPAPGPPSSTGPVAATGASVQEPLGLAVLLLVTGSGLLLGARRRRIGRRTTP